MERRCQEVIDRCWALGDENPISFIHDVGSGGISNALPALVNAGGRGERFQLRAVPNDEPGMSPLEIWCNKSQVRYVMAGPAAAPVNLRGTPIVPDGTARKPKLAPPVWTLAQGKSHREMISSLLRSEVIRGLHRCLYLQALRSRCHQG